MNTQTSLARVPMVFPVMQVYESVKTHDMRILKKYAVEKDIYTAEEIDAVEDEYKKYIAMCIAHPRLNFPISKKVDDLWHTHLLFTQDYHKMCQEQAGHFIHHRPKILDDEAGLKTAFSDTLEYYTRAFGTPDKTYWDEVVCKSANCASWDVQM